MFLITFADIEQTGAGLTVLRVVSSSIEEAANWKM